VRYIDVCSGISAPPPRHRWPRSLSRWVVVILFMSILLTERWSKIMADRNEIVRQRQSAIRRELSACEVASLSERAVKIAAVAA